MNCPLDYIFSLQFLTFSFYFYHNSVLANEGESEIEIEQNEE